MLQLKGLVLILCLFALIISFSEQQPKPAAECVLMILTANSAASFKRRECEEQVFVPSI